ncbi:MAG: hypothetical protein FJX59_11175 [Alphaproteobacteria bacterium]|nr:hypothetical protein [Alphaproteobacteria bacterium]
MTASLSAGLLGAITIGLVGAALAQEPDVKSEVVVSNHMPGSIRMRVDYVWRTYSWNLVDTPVSEGADLIYRIPTALPGCEYLTQWGIDRAKLTLSNASGEICAAEFSICQRRSETVIVRPTGCTSDVRG